MSKDTPHVLILEDHQLNREQTHHNVLKVYCQANCVLCQTTLEAEESLQKHQFDLAVLDLKVPSKEVKTGMNGYFFAKQIKANFPKTKILLSTMIEEEFLIHEILVDLEPDGFLLKSECGNQEMQEGIQKVMNDESVYSPSAMQIKKRFRFFEREVNLSLEQYQLLLLIEAGKTNNYQQQAMGYKYREKVPKERQKIRQAFGVDTDEELLEKARSMIKF